MVLSSRPGKKDLVVQLPDSSALGVERASCRKQVGFSTPKHGALRGLARIVAKPHSGVPRPAWRWPGALGSPCSLNGLRKCLRQRRLSQHGCSGAIFSNDRKPLALCVEKAEEQDRFNMGPRSG